MKRVTVYGCPICKTYLGVSEDAREHIRESEGCTMTGLGQVTVPCETQE